MVNIMQTASAKFRIERGASHQPTFMDSCLLVARVWPVYLVDELVLVFCTPYDWANGGSIDIFLRMVSMALVLWGVGTILGNGHRIQGQNYVALLLGSEMSAGFHYRNLILGI